MKHICVTFGKHDVIIAIMKYLTSSATFGRNFVIRMTTTHSWPKGLSSLKGFYWQFQIQT